MPTRPLYFMAKPPLDVAALIAALPRTSRRRPRGLLHITLLPLVDLADVPPQTLPDLLATMAGFEGAPFRVVFDRIAEHGAVTLRGSEAMIGVHAFQRQLARFLTLHGVAFVGRPPVPHVTIAYRRDGLGDAELDPISWQVTELLLVESVYGETRHVVHARWPLRAGSG